MAGERTAVCGCCVITGTTVDVFQKEGNKPHGSDRITVFADNFSEDKIILLLMSCLNKTLRKDLFN